MSVLVLEEADLRRIFREEIREALSARPSSTDDRRVTYAEAGAAAGVSPATIRTWAAAGLVKRYGEGRGVRFSLSEVLAVAPSETKQSISADEFAVAALRARHG